MGNRQPVYLWQKQSQVKMSLGTRKGRKKMKDWKATTEKESNREKEGFGKRRFD